MNQKQKQVPRHTKNKSISAASFAGGFGKAIRRHLRPRSCHSRGGGQNLKVNLMEMMRFLNRGANMLVFQKSSGIPIKA